MPKLERTLRHFSKDFGEASAQAVIRWSVNTCRGLYKETQVFGASAKVTKQKQVDAIITGARQVILIAATATQTRRGWKCTNRSGTFYTSSRKMLSDPTAVNRWIELNRTRRGGQTAKLKPKDRMVCTKEVFDKAIEIRSKRAGMAKGGWLVAGQKIANSMKGMGMTKMGRNFGGYAFNAAKGLGSAVIPQPGFKPEAWVTNKVSHVAAPRVLPRKSYDKELAWGLKNTLSWYSRQLKAIDRKKTV